MRRDVFLLCPFLFLLASCATGCGPGVGDVAGVVTYQGKLLNHGNVRIMPATGLSVDSPIAADGTYCCKGVTVGSGKVCVTCMDDSMANTLKAMRGKTVDPQQKGRMPTPISASGGVPSFSLIPSFYSDFENSGLVVMVKEGTTTYDIVLTREGPKLAKAK